MPAPRDLEPVAMTESERLAERRFEAGFVFETMPAPRYTPTTIRGTEYRKICWWYASGRNDQNGVDLVDDDAFADWAAARADDYVNGVTSSLPSVRDLFYDYFNREE